MGSKKSTQCGPTAQDAYRRLQGKVDEATRDFRASPRDQFNGGVLCGLTDALEIVKGLPINARPKTPGEAWRPRSNVDEAQCQAAAFGAFSPWLDPSSLTYLTSLPTVEAQKAYFDMVERYGVSDVDEVLDKIAEGSDPRYLRRFFEGYRLAEVKEYELVKACLDIIG